MKNIPQTLYGVILGSCLFLISAQSVFSEREFITGTITNINTAKNTILVDSSLYKLQPGVKVNDSSDKKMPSKYNLKVGHDIRFTLKKKKHKHLEVIKEIWIVRG
ncbi:MAG: hypothetical protein OEY52_07465 [Gammaproteobacteria bacterium]|nr:hypothetical protein [Gammaproteobacteria bacterium]